MSFGESAAVRFANHEGGKQPVIFWQKQDTEAKNVKTSKKVGRGKSQNFPLRKPQQPPPRPPANRKPPPAQVTKESTNKKPETRQYGAKKKKVPETAGTVVLTQKEFDAILDTIGQLALEADIGTKTKPGDITDPGVSVELSAAYGALHTESRSGDNTLTRAKPLSPSPDLPAAQPLSPSPEPTKQFSDATHSSHQVAARAGVRTSMEKPLTEVIQAVRGVPTGHMTKAERKRLQWEREKVEESKQTEWDPWGRPGAGAPVKDAGGNLMADYKSRADTSKAGTPGAASHQVTHHVTQQDPADEVFHVSYPKPPIVATVSRHTHPLDRYTQNPEVKKPAVSMMQTAPVTTPTNPVQTEWDPWGRPGAGAPVKDAGGNLMADYKSRASHEVKKPAVSMMQTAPVTTTTNPVYGGGMNSTTPAAVTTGGFPPPAAIRSSIVIGEAEPNENRFESAKDRQKREWLADLEKQRLEQRQRKVSEKTQKQEGETYDTWADHFSTYKPSGLPEQPTSKTFNHTEIPTQSGDTGHTHGTDAGELGGTYGRANSAPVVPPTENPAPGVGDVTATHIRGQNVFIDPKVLQELEEKRKKQLEHQEYIRQQIEEKERLKRADKERQIREEQEEEQKLQRERDKLSGQLQQEKDKARAKEEVEKQRLESLRKAMEQAQEYAEREKHAKRVRKLQRAGHDTTQLNANFEAKMTPRAGALTSTSTVQVDTSPRDFHIMDQPHNESSPHQHMDQSYGGQKVLTPTKFRETPASEPNSPRREYGVQTDPRLDVYSGHKPASRESTDIVYQEPVYEKKKKQVRVISAPREQTLSKSRVRSAPLEETTSEEVAKTKRPLKIKERPGWGYQNAKKKRPVKQSEKDPFYEQKLRKRELVGSLRQEQMLKMADKHCPKTYKVTTAASRARSRSNDRDEHRSRSRSPPRSDPVVSEGRRSRKDSQNRRGDSPAGRVASRNSSVHRRSTSPPIPAIKHRSNYIQNANQYGGYENTRHTNNESRRDQTSSNRRHMTSRTGSRSDQPSHRDKYQDQGLVQAPVKNNDFIPFIRSSNVLNPAHAESPMPLSREPSVMERARKAYVQEHDPAKFGFHMDNFRDDLNKRMVPPQSPNKNAKRAPDPILNPELVKEHPTGRQSQILQHLSDLRRGLMQKQRELEMDQGITVE